jgi:photosystem II stability/assembly factor-like uncharacterized protein/flagellar hook assembly protein FlgD
VSQRDESTHRRGRWRALAAGCLAAVLMALGTPSIALGAPAQGSGGATVDPSLLQGLEWRSIGPLRGSRSIAAAGSPSRRGEYYFGAMGGGLWKTTDGGTNWRPVTDGQLNSSSVGAVAVCESNPDVVYAGTGEVQFRENIIQGDGVYKSTDAGQTWTHLGLDDTQAISRIRIDPSDCNRVYAAAMGHPFGPNTERGVFRSTDGGQSWSRVLFRDDQTGAADLVMDRNDPDVLYAGLWQARMTPWGGSDGGPGSGLFKSADGGDSWTNLTRNPGLPQGIVGKVGVAVSGADSDRVYAIISAKEPEAGVYASDDAGATWRKINDGANLRSRPHYYTRIYADPQARDTLYVLTDGLWKSTNAGQTFQSIRAPHADHHDLWIDPSDPRRLIDTNDGGANVSVDGGANWTAQDYATGQMYRVMTTNDVPYLVCGGQQENGTACVSSEGTGEEFFSVGGGESGYVANDPRDSNVFYAGNFGGSNFTRFDRRLPFQRKRIDVWPEVPFGFAPKDIRERFAWSFPIVTTPAYPQAVYTSSQHLFRSTNEGQSWKQISPDLTRAAPETLELPFGPIFFHPNSSYTYATISAVAPSPIDRNLIWAGSDDGLIHVTRNGGGTWTDVTPPDLGQFTTVAVIDASPHHPGTAYVAAHRYKLEDRTPYIYKTDDFGRTWTKIVDGIPGDDFARTVREDPAREGLLYTGTEHGVYVSFDDGGSWQSLRQNLPDTQVRDLQVKDDDLVIATYGRGFYVMDDISPLRQMTPEVATDAVHLYDPADARMSVDRGATVTYHLTRPVDRVSLEFVDAEGRTVDTIAGAPAGAGMHRVLWKPATGTGSFEVRLTAGGQSETQAFDVVTGPPRTVGAFPAAAPAERGRPTEGQAPPQEGSSFQLLDPADPIRLVDSGVTVSYSLSQPAEQVTLDFLDKSGTLIRSFSGSQVPGTPGEHGFSWNLRYPGPTVFPGLVFQSASTTNGPRAAWGEYTVRLTVDGESREQVFEIQGDPRLEGVSSGDIRRQFRLGLEVRDRTSDANEAVIAIRDCRGQVDDRVAEAGDDEVTARGTRLADALGVIERELYQTEFIPGVSWEGVEPLRLNNQIASLLPIIESAESRPTDQTYEAFRVFSERLDRQRAALEGLFGDDVAEFNQLLRDRGVEVISCG